MSCKNNKCDPSKMDMKDKAIRMLIESFKKKLIAVESIACKKEGANLKYKRDKLLAAFEEYLKELVIC